MKSLPLGKERLYKVSSRRLNNPKSQPPNLPLLRISNEETISYPVCLPGQLAKGNTLFYLPLAHLNESQHRGSKNLQI